MAKLGIHSRQRVIGVALLLLALLLTVGYRPVTAAPPQQSTTTPLPVDDYLDLLRDTRTVIATGDASETELRDLRLRLLDVTAIEYDDGRIAAVDHAFLAQQLEDNEALSEQLDTVIALIEARQAGGLSASEAEAADATLRDVLSRNEFQYPDEEPGLTLRERILMWLADAWNALFIRLFQNTTTTQLRIIRTLLTAVGIIGFAFILLLVLRNLNRNLALRSAVLRDDSAELGDLTADRALKQAQTLSDDGDYRTAVRYLYLSTLLSLEERGVLRYDRSLTNREYLRLVSSQPELRGVLQDVIDIFDQVWYGFQPITPEAYATYQQQVAELRTPGGAV